MKWNKIIYKVFFMINKVRLVFIQNINFYSKSNPELVPLPYILY